MAAIQFHNIQKKQKKVQTFSSRSQIHINILEPNILLVTGQVWLVKQIPI